MFNYKKLIVKKGSLFLWVLLILGICSCNTQTPKKSEKELTIEIEQALQSYVKAIKTLDADAVLEFWTEDCRVIEGNIDIEGKNKLRALLIPAYKTLTIFELDVTTKKLYISEHLAIHITEHSEILSENGKRTRGEKLLVWRKEHGKWKICMDYSIQ